MEAVMSVLGKIAYYQGQRDEVPNQVLAVELAQTKNTVGIREIVNNLENKNNNIRSDCLKVLYEIGYIDPSLIAGNVNEFLKLLNSKDNRMVWGAMIGLGLIASQCSKDIWNSIDDVIRVTESGTVITKVWGMRTLAEVAAKDSFYKQKIFPILIKQIQSCIPRDVPTHSASILCAVDHENEAAFMAVINSRVAELNSAQLARLKKVLKKLEQIKE